MKSQLQENEVSCNRQISKSVERITTQIENLKNLCFNQRTEDDEKFNVLYKELRDIKHLCKKRAKKQSRRILDRDTSNTNTVMVKTTEPQSRADINDPY